MVSPFHPDKAQLEPVGFSTFSADPLDEFRSSLYPLFSLWFRLGHNRMLLNIISMGTTRNSLKVNATEACRSRSLKQAYIMVWYPQTLSSRENEVAAGNSESDDVIMPWYDLLAQAKAEVTRCQRNFTTEG